MTGTTSELAPFVAALRIGDDGAILLDDVSVGRVSGVATEDALATALMPVVYEHAYARVFPRDDAVAAVDPADLTTALECANTSRSRAEQGWIFSGSDTGGSVLASRHGRTRRFVPGQFLAIDGVVPMPKGSALAVQIAGGSATAQPGFYYAFGEAFRDVNDLAPMVRFYWNVRIGGAVDLVAGLTTLLNRYRIPFDFKIVVRSADYTRRDNAVLYVAQHLFPAVSTILLAAYPAFAALLDQPVPLFARRLAPGLGFAEDPGNRESFGMARSRLVAQALAASRADDGFAAPLFAETLTARIAEAGLRADALWLNAGSDDQYDVPPMLSQQAIH